MDPRLEDIMWTQPIDEMCDYDLFYKEERLVREEPLAEYTKLLTAECVRREITEYTHEELDASTPENKE